MIKHTFEQTLRIALGAVALAGLVACASTSSAESGAKPAAAEPAATEPAPADEAQAAASTAPDREKVVAHAQKHVTYPLNREGILAICAETPEFTEEEKAWIADRLPEGEYASAEELISALGL